MTPTPITAAAPALANHLWQSTAFAATIWLLTLLLRNNHARIRYSLWLAASIKFLLPFSLLITLGTLLPRPQQIAPPSTIYSAIDTASQPFTQLDTIAPATPTPTLDLKDRLTAQLPTALAILWLCGAITVLLIWLTRWRQVHATLKKSTPITQGREHEILRRLETHTNKPIALVRSPELMEPGIFGILRPTLLWPHRLSDHLEDHHIEAILAHETIHVQRRDNLTAALHMLVEAAFWFHPIVWWMERRMIEERERACDEAVVQQGGNPETYAESLLKACRFCLESPLPCVAGITGADLSRRVRSIMTLQLEKLGVAKKLLLAAIGLAVLAGPLAFGVMHENPLFVQLLRASGPLPTFEVATIKPSNPERKINVTIDFDLTTFSSQDTTVKDLIQVAYGINSDDQILGLSGWMLSNRYDVVGKMPATEFIDPHKSSLENEATYTPARLMLQALLAERFALQIKPITKETSVYELIVAKNGSKMSPSNLKPNQSQSGQGIHSNSKGEMTGKDATMAYFAKVLSDLPQLGATGSWGGGRLVVDRTVSQVATTSPSNGLQTGQPEHPPPTTPDRTSSQRYKIN